MNRMPGADRNRADPALGAATAPPTRTLISASAKVKDSITRARSPIAFFFEAVHPAHRRVLMAIDGGDRDVGQVRDGERGAIGQCVFGGKSCDPPRGVKRDDIEPWILHRIPKEGDVDSAFEHRVVRVGERHLLDPQKGLGQSPTQRRVERRVQVGRAGREMSDA
jgi:hypothetical protein